MLDRFLLAFLQQAPAATPAESPDGSADSAEEASANTLAGLTDITSIDDVREKGSALWQLAESYALLYLPKVLFAAIWLVIGLFIIKLIVSGVGRAFRLRNIDESVRIFVMSVLRVGLRILLIIMVLGLLGVPTASLGFIIGAASLAIGFALKDTLQNFAGGVIILLLKPYKVGDFIEAAGFSGTVKEVQIFNTIMATSDNCRIIVPNGQLSTSALKNFSVHETRRVEVILGIGYDDDIERARAVVRGLIDADARTLVEPEPVIKVGELADSSVNLVVRVWVERGDFWGYRVDLLEKVKAAFDAEGISIPYPQSEVTMRSAQT